MEPTEHSITRLDGWSYITIGGVKAFVAILAYKQSIKHEHVAEFAFELAKEASVAERYANKYLMTVEGVESLVRPDGGIINPQELYPQKAKIVKMAGEDKNFPSGPRLLRRNNFNKPKTDLFYQNIEDQERVYKSFIARVRVFAQNHKPYKKSRIHKFITGTENTTANLTPTKLILTQDALKRIATKSFTLFARYRWTYILAGMLSVASLIIGGAKLMKENMKVEKTG